MELKIKSDAQSRKPPSFIPLYFFFNFLSFPCIVENAGLLLYGCKSKGSFGNKKKKKDLLFSLCSSGLSELSLLTWNHFQVMQDLYTYLDLNEEGYQFKPQMAVCPVFPTVSPSGRGGLLQKWWLVSR